MPLLKHAVNSGQIGPSAPESAPFCTEYQLKNKYGKPSFQYKRLCFHYSQFIIPSKDNAGHIEPLTTVSRTTIMYGMALREGHYVGHIRKY
jgi:hypothetical protein